MDDDIDITFEGSPLAKHMAECGIDQDIQKVDGKEDKKAQSKCKSLWERIRSMGNFWAKKPVISYYRNKALEEIIRSNILDRDDVEFCIRECLFGDDSFEYTTRRKLIGHGVRDMIITLLPTVAIYTTKMKLSLKMTMMCLPPICLFWHWRMLYSSYCKMKRLNSYLANAKKYNTMLKEVLQFLSDNDLVNRGYLMTQKSGYLWNAETSKVLELSKQSQSSLPGLRISVLQTTTRLAVAYSLATVKEEGRYPLPSNLDHEAMHLPQFSVEDLKLLDQYDGRDAVIPSLRQLKSILEIMSIRQVEYVKRITSSILFNARKGSLDIYVDPGLIAEIMDCFQQLSLALTIHRCNVKLSSGNEKVAGKKSDSGNSLNDLKCLFRSSLAHIRQAVISSDIVGKYLDDFGQEELDIVEMEEGIKKIIFFIQSSELCLSKGIKIIRKMDSKRQVVCTGDMVQNICMKIEDGVDKNIAEAGDLEIPQDEVFELMLRGDADDTEHFEEIDDGREEIGRETGLMMIELRNVLRNRAEVWEEREKVARKHVVGDTEAVDEISPVGGQMEMLDKASDGKRMPDDIDELNILFSGDELSGSVEDNIIPMNNTGMAQGFNLGALAAEAAAKACRSGLNSSEVESYEFLGDDMSDF